MRWPLNDPAHTTLWEGDGWKIVDTHNMAAKDMSIVAIHIECDHKQADTNAWISWMWDDAGYGSYICFGCHVDIPESVQTLMALYVGLD